MSKLAYITHDKLSLPQLRHSCYLCEDMSVKSSEKTYHKCDDMCIKDHLKYGYVQLHYYKNDFFYVTTPPMKCLFGVQKNGFNNFQMSLQFTDLESDSTMKHFYRFIEDTEFRCMELLGLSPEDSDRFISQIRHDKKGRYEPNLSVKLPFRYNKFETDIYSEREGVPNLLHIQSFSEVQCDIYLDKIWKMNDKFFAKWKVKCVHVL